jgi:hypothetical protein
MVIDGSTNDWLIDGAPQSEKDVAPETQAIGKTGAVIPTSGSGAGEAIQESGAPVWGVASP